MNKIHRDVTAEEDNSLVCVCDTSKACLNINNLCSKNCQKLYLLTHGLILGSVLQSLLGGLCGNGKFTTCRLSSDKRAQHSEPYPLSLSPETGTYRKYETNESLPAAPKSKDLVCKQSRNSAGNGGLDLSHSVVSESANVNVTALTKRVDKTTKSIEYETCPKTKSLDPPVLMCIKPLCNPVANDSIDASNISGAVSSRAAKQANPKRHCLRVKPKHHSRLTLSRHVSKKNSSWLPSVQASLKSKRCSGVKLESKNDIYDATTTSSVSDENSLVVVTNSYAKASRLKKIETCSTGKDSSGTQKGRVKCKQCGKMISKSYLYVHYRAVHKDNLSDISDSSVSCSECGKMFMRKQALNAHKIKLHSHAFTNSCSYCGKCFASLFGLSWHKRQVHKVTVRQCGKCGETFENRRDYKKHRRCKHTVNSHVCHICGKGFKLKNALQAHLDAHAGVKLHFCEICGDGFVRFSSLCQHKNNLHGPKKSDLPFKCHLCPNTFRLKAWLDKHITQKHNSSAGQLDEDCKMCQSSMMTSVSCPVHGKEIVKDTFPCSQCDKVFAKDTSLKVHMKQHEEPKFYCDICHKKFTYKCNMMRHKDTHNTEKSFCCHICAKQFCTKFLLASHTRMHNQDLMFKCEICGKGLTRKDYLKNHMKKMHPGSTHSTCSSSVLSTGSVATASSNNTTKLNT